MCGARRCIKKHQFITRIESLQKQTQLLMGLVNAGVSPKTLWRVTFDSRVTGSPSLAWAEEGASAQRGRAGWRFKRLLGDR